MKPSQPKHSPSPSSAPARGRYDAWAVAAPGLESLLEAELRTLGFTDATASTGGVRFACDGQGLVRANLHSRLASRVVVRLASFKALAFHELERAARRVEWTRMLAPGASYRLRVTAKKSRLYHSDAIAQRVGEAIERAVAGARRVDGPARDEDESADETPHALGVAVDAPSAQLFVVRFEHDRCTVSADSSGALLHRRGYRQAVAKAPMRETLAAAMLAAARYDASQPLVDPFCGSGTLLIERLLAGPAAAAVGIDHDDDALAAARDNLEAAGLTRRAALVRADALHPSSWATGPGADVRPADLILADPPWGTLHGSHSGAAALHSGLLRAVHEVAADGARLVVLTHEVKVMEAAVRAADALWRPRPPVRVYAKGHHPRIWVLDKLA